jgi:hypothetical protein
MPCEGSEWRQTFSRIPSTLLWCALSAGALSVFLALTAFRRLRKAVQQAPATRKLATLRSPRAPAGIGHQWFLWGRNSPHVSLLICEFLSQVDAHHSNLSTIVHHDVLLCSQLFKLLTQWGEEHGPFYQITLRRRSLVVSDLRAIQVKHSATC